MGKRKWLLAAAGAVATVAVGFGAVMAQSGDEVTGTSFLDRVAAKLGIDTPKLEEAIEDARSEEIDEAVANGDLTQEQADQLKEKLEGLPVPLGGEFGFGGRFGGEGFGFAFRFDEGGPKFGFHAGFDHEGLAEFLGITPEQLGEELQADGVTLTTVAEAHGKSREELQAFIAGEAKAKLDDAVTRGDLTQERADEIYARLQEHIDKLIDHEMPGYGRPGLFFRDGTPPFGEEGDTVPEQSGELEPASRS